MALTQPNLDVWLSNQQNLLWWQNFVYVMSDINICIFNKISNIHFKSTFSSNNFTNCIRKEISWMHHIITPRIIHFSLFFWGGEGFTKIAQILFLHKCIAPLFSFSVLDWAQAHFELKFSPAKARFFISAELGNTSQIDTAFGIFFSNTGWKKGRNRADIAFVGVFDGRNLAGGYIQTFYGVTSKARLYCCGRNNSK